MQYLVFGVLLIFGAIVIGLFLFSFHAKNKVDAVVVESYCDFKNNEQHIETMEITHVFELESGDEKKRLETKLFPVRELSGAKVELYYDREQENIYIPDYQKYIPLIGTFALTGLLCVLLYLCQSFQFFHFDTDREWIVLLFAAIGVMAFSHICLIISTAVIKTKGNYEGVLVSENGNEDTEIYSLWYGEHRQYARRVKGMWLKNRSDEAVTLFFHTKTGTVYRMQELVFSLCISVMAFAAMIVMVVSG